MKRRANLTLLTLAVFAMIAAIMLTGCCCGTDMCNKAGLMKPTIAVKLSEKYNTPDGMVLGPDNYIYLNIPNFNDHNHPPKVIKISPTDQVSEVCTLPLHPKTGDIYVADFVGDAVHKIDKNGKVTTIAKNEKNSGGVGGKLDKPSEVCLRGNKIYIANIDLPFGGNKYDDLHTIPVIDLDK